MARGPGPLSRQLECAAKWEEERSVDSTRRKTKRVVMRNGVCKTESQADVGAEIGRKRHKTAVEARRRETILHARSAQPLNCWSKPPTSAPGINQVKRLLCDVTRGMDGCVNADVMTMTLTGETEKEREREVVV